MDHSHHHHHHGDMMMTEEPASTHNTVNHNDHRHHHNHNADPEIAVGSMDSMSKDSMAMMSMGTMSTGFHFQTNTHFLFEGLCINSIYGIAIAILLTTIAAVLYEGCNSFVVSHRAVKDTRLSKQKLILRKVLFTLLKTFSIGLGYIVMLAVMTFNVWILISVILGSGISHHIIRPMIYQHLNKHNDDRPTVTSTEVLHDFPPEECGQLLHESEKEPNTNGKVLDSNDIEMGDTGEDSKLMAGSSNR